MAEPATALPPPGAEEAASLEVEPSVAPESGDRTGTEAPHVREPDTPLPPPPPPPPPPCERAPRRLVLVVGDGMGPAQELAASLYVADRDEALAWHTFPRRGRLTTAAADDPITDSAASATAMATGVLVNNEVVSVARPGTGEPLPTLLEFYRDCGRATGFVTTSTHSHATPAAFAAHVESRNELREIARQMLEETRPTLLFGGGGYGVTPATARAAGYDVVAGRDALVALEGAIPEGPPTPLVGVFRERGHLPYVAARTEIHPSLPEMARVALTWLDRSESGFFLLVEGARIDHAGHDNLLDELVLETVELSETVDALHDALEAAGDYLLFVTADHETGGLEVSASRGAGHVPEARFTTDKHTAVDVNWYAVGDGVEVIPARIPNTSVFSVFRGEPVPAAPPGVPEGAPDTGDERSSAP